jgi:hypothetical protein
METRFDVQVRRTRTASGWEWFLTVGGYRVQTNSAGTGVFTDPDGRVEDVFPRLVTAMVRREMDRA